MKKSFKQLKGDETPEELVSMLPKQNRPDGSLIELADNLFKVMVGTKDGQIETQSRKIRFTYSPEDGNTRACIRIFLDNKLSLWWFWRDEQWRYDGWEAGDYTRLDSKTELTNKVKIV